MRIAALVLSTLLGSHPPRLPARHLVRVGELFGVAEGTIRVALSRMVTAGDLVQVEGEYGLSERLLQRQRRQDESRAPRTRPWDGAWEIAVITTDRRPAADEGFEHATSEPIVSFDRLVRVRRCSERDLLARPGRPIQLAAQHVREVCLDEDQG